MLSFDLLGELGRNEMTRPARNQAASLRKPLIIYILSDLRGARVTRIPSNQYQFLERSSKESL
jgi:hypothetical protein